MIVGNKKISNYNIIEFCSITIIWIAIYSIPYFQNRTIGIIVWESVFEDWIKITAFLLIFLFNTYFFVPKILFVKRYFQYFGIILVVSFSIICSLIWIQTKFTSRNPVEMPPMEIGPGLPPMELGSTMPLPKGYRPNQKSIQTSVNKIFFDYLIIAFLVLGAGTTQKTIIRWINEENRRKDIEKEQLKTELALLRHQINPHFLMNTLNNIHALMDIDVEKAKESVIRLSTLMRYLLYDSSQGKTSITKELQFIESYIDLMRLRYSEKVRIDFQIPENIPEVLIPSLLFVSFIENAFKHGVSYRKQSFVQFKMDVQNDKINCTIRNSKHPNNTIEKTKYSGIGMENVRRSLELLYKKDYTLLIKDEENEYEINLTIPLYENQMHSH